MPVSIAIPRMFSGGPDSRLSLPSHEHSGHCSQTAFLIIHTLAEMQHELMNITLYEVYMLRAPRQGREEGDKRPVFNSGRPCERVTKVQCDVIGDVLFTSDNIEYCQYGSIFLGMEVDASCFERKTLDEQDGSDPRSLMSTVLSRKVPKLLSIRARPCWGEK